MDSDIIFNIPIGTQSVALTNEIAPSYQHTSSFSFYTGSKDITTTWTSIGSIYNSIGYNQVGIFTNLVPNSGSSIQFRIVGSFDGTSGSLYELPISFPSANSGSALYTLYYTLTDASYWPTNLTTTHSTVFSFELSNVVPYFQLQVRCSVSGSVSPVIGSTYGFLGNY